MYDYLKTLPLTDAQKAKVVAEKYENAPTFYMMCRAIPVATKQWLGLSSLAELEAALLQLMTEEEKAAVESELAELAKM